MPAHKLVSDAQDRALLDFVQENPGLALGRVSAQAAPLAKLQAQEAWESLASRLNAMGSGTTKSAVKWKDYWNERKCAVRKKAAKLRAYAVGTGGGPAKTTKLTDVEEEILHIIGKISVYGEPSVRIPFNTASSTSQSPALLPQRHTPPTETVPADIPDPVEVQALYC